MTTSSSSREGASALVFSSQFRVNAVCRDSVYYNFSAVEEGWVEKSN